MRLFVAVNLPDAERGAIAASLASLRDAGLPVRWSRPEDLHITLKFLGEVPTAQAESIGSAIRAAVEDARAFDVCMRGIGAFPSIEAPRVIWLGVERHPALELLANDVECALASFGFESELRPFHPHITLGRVRREARPPQLRPLAELAGRFDWEGAMLVDRVDLMESRPGPKGPHYAVRHGAPLRGADPT